MAWLDAQFKLCYEHALKLPWILDIDTTIRHRVHAGATRTTPAPLPVQAAADQKRQEANSRVVLAQRLG